MTSEYNINSTTPLLQKNPPLTQVRVSNITYYTHDNRFSIYNKLL